MICVTHDNGAAVRRGRCVAGKSRRRWRLRAGVALLAATLLAPAAAAAADLDGILRGSYSDWYSTKSYSRWDGWNFGVQVGASNLNSDFGGATSSLIAFILRNTTVEDQFSPSSWTTLPSNSSNGQQYGVFLGYNWQWDQLVVGFDAGYNRFSSLASSAGDSIARQVVTQPDNVNHALTITAQSSIQLIDYATMRARAGYSIGQFLPYAMIGAAVGRFNYANSVIVHDIGTPPAGSPILPFDVTDTKSSTRNGEIVGGIVAGLGADVALMPNVFLRGEWEFVAFAPVGGIRTSINTGRVALGAKF